MKIANSSYFLDLSALLDALQKQGIAIGVDTHLQLQHLLTDLQHETDHQVWHNCLAAVLCKSQKELLIFNNHFSRFFKMDVPQSDIPKQEMEKDKPDTPTLTPSQRYKKAFNDFLQKIKERLNEYIKAIKKLVKPEEQISVAEQQQGKLPEYVIRVRTSKHFVLNLPDAIKETAHRLRTRESIGAQYLDLPKTIAATIQNLGAFSPVYADYTQYTEYLVLIQADNRSDHRAQLYDTFFQELQDRHIPAQRYFFRQTPFYFYDKTPKETIDLDALTHRHRRSIWLVFADTATFLNARNYEPYAWVNNFHVFDKGFLFLPFGHSIEAKIAQKLKAVFEDVLTADEVGFEQLERQLIEHQTARFAETIKYRANFPLLPLTMRTEQDILDLPLHLHDLRLLGWIYACAVYPDCSWKLTLFIGDALSTEEFQYNTWQNIQQLARIDWFKNAYMPDWCRAIILKQTHWFDEERAAFITQTIQDTIKQNPENGEELTQIYNQNKIENLTQLAENLKAEGNYIAHKIINSKDKNLLVFEIELPTPPPLAEGAEGRLTVDDSPSFGGGRGEAKPNTEIAENEPNLIFEDTAIAEAEPNLIAEPIENSPSFGGGRGEANFEQGRGEAEMILIKGGNFLMGSNEQNREKPIHEVNLQDFHIGKYPVTQREWRAVMGQDPPELRFKGCDDCPVERVSWNDIQEFIQKLNEITGKNYRLPTEAEWEYAARGGNQSKGYKYAGSNNLDEVGWYDKNSDSKTHPVGTKKPNELGLYDMSGNVWEWCQDVWHENYEGAPNNGSAWMEGGNHSRRVLRGGSWFNDADGCRSAFRLYYSPVNRNGNYGFRFAL